MFALVDAPHVEITARVQADLDLPSYQYFVWKEKLLDLGKALREATPEDATKAVAALSEAQLLELAQNIAPVTLSTYPGFGWLNEGLSPRERAQLFEGLVKLDVLQLQRVYAAVSEESYDAALALSQAVADHASPALKVQFLALLTAQIGLGVETIKDKKLSLVRSAVDDGRAYTAVTRATRGARGAAAILGSLRDTPAQFDEAAEYLRRGDLNLRSDLLSTVLSGARDVRIHGSFRCGTTCPAALVTMQPEALAAILDGALRSDIEDVRCEIATDGRVIVTDMEAKVSAGDAKPEDLRAIGDKVRQLQQQLAAAGTTCPFKPIVIKL